MPLIENPGYLLTQYEFDLIHKFVNESTKSDGDSIQIGFLANEKSKSISVSVDSLFASHIGIFGNTGSGKSYTLAALYHKLFEKYNQTLGFKKLAKFLLVDFNGEYIGDGSPQGSSGNIITEARNKQVYDIKPDGNEVKLPFLKESLLNIEILSIILDAKDKTQIPFLKRVLAYKKIDRIGLSKFIKEDILQAIIEKKDKELGKKIFVEFFSDLENAVGGNNEVFREIHSTIEILDKYANDSTSYFINDGKINRHQGSTYFEENFTKPLHKSISKIKFSNTILSELKTRILLKYYKEIVTGHANREHISPLIRRAMVVLDSLDRIIDVKEHTTRFIKPLTIISLKDIYDNSLKKIISLLVCKEWYDQKKKRSEEKEYLNIIIDEAHNILSYSSDRESETWKDYRLETFEEIIKEGRKFGVFLTIASQRPSDISSTIISQLHNYFLHRLINNRDIEAVERTISYLDKVSFDSLPILPTGTCIFAGLSAHVPIILEIESMNPIYEPRNKTIQPSAHWINLT